MSVKEIVLISNSSPDLSIKKIGDKISIKFPDIPVAVAMLDRNQVHLLMLYLQEHLK